MPLPVVAIFDVGRTNKKFLLLDEQYNIAHEECVQLKETMDDEGFNCEDIDALDAWIKNRFGAMLNDSRYAIRGVNISAYGASLVYEDINGKRIAPLYNYLKPYPKKLQDDLYQRYGGESLFSKQTASPVLGSLNSGLQLYRIKNEKRELYNRIAFAFHLPQYLSFLLTGFRASEITSIGCHTHLWDFRKEQYHKWVTDEKMNELFPPLADSGSAVPFQWGIQHCIGGIGLHDSSAALLPYIKTFTEPFVLLSTGTWCISLNPFNNGMLTDYELHHDCLCYLSAGGKPVKASRLFAGHEHEQQTKRLAVHFHKAEDYYTSISHDPHVPVNLVHNLSRLSAAGNNVMIPASGFASRDLNSFSSYEDAYRQLMTDIIYQQVHSLNLVMKESRSSQIFVDGGFSKNDLYMKLLAACFPDKKVYAASVSQASALGAAMVIHKHWSRSRIPENIVTLKHYRL